MKRIFIISFIIILATGCKKFLDIKPKGTAIPEKFDEYARLLNSQLQLTTGDRYQSYMTDNVQLASGDTSFSYQKMANSIFRRTYSFEPGDIYEIAAPEDDKLWTRSYRNIFVYNTIINNIMDVRDAPNSKKRRLLAEAIVGRAYEFLQLVSIYSKAYNPATASTDRGIPLNLSEDVANFKFEVFSVGKVYDFILSDLGKIQADDLDVVSANTFRPGKSALHALKSRILLQMGEYNKSLEEAKRALAISDTLLDLNKYGIKSGNVLGGRIALLPGLTVSFPEGNNNPENLFVRYPLVTHDLNAYCYVSDDLLALYNVDLQPGEQDKRRSLWYVNNKFSSFNFPGRTMWVQYVRPNFGLSTIEMILNAAECYARSGTANDLIEASRLYNYLRKHRVANQVDIQFTNAEEALVKILNERRRELALIGIHRFVDIKRLNLDSRFAKTIRHTADGNEWTLPPNDPRWAFPIPPNVREFHPEIELDR